MDNDEQCSERLVSRYKQKQNPLKTSQQQQVLQYGIKLDPSIIEIKQDNSQLNIRQKQIFKDRATSSKINQTRQSTLSPSQQNKQNKGNKTFTSDSKEIRDIFMQTRPNLQELLSPLNYYFKKNENFNSTQFFGQQEKYFRESKKRLSSKSRKRDEKTQEIYKQINEILKNPQVDENKKQKRMYLHNYHEEDHLNSFLNNTPLNLSNIKPLEIEIQQPSTKSQSSAAERIFSNNELFQLKNIALKQQNKNDFEQRRAFTSLNSQNKNKFRLFSTKPNKVDNQSFSNNQSPIQSPINQIKEQPIQARKIISVYKHRQIYSRSINRKEETQESIDQNQTVNKTLESEIPDRFHLYQIEDKNINQQQEYSKKITLSPQNKEILPIGIHQRINRFEYSSKDKQTTDSTYNTYNQTKTDHSYNNKRLDTKSIELDISQINFEKQFVTLSNNLSVKNSFLFENNMANKNHIKSKVQTENNSIIDEQNAENENGLNIKFVKKINLQANSNAIQSRENSQNKNKEEEENQKQSQVTIKKSQIIKKFMNDIIMKNQQNPLSNIKNDETYIQKVVDKYCYKKIFNNSKNRNKTSENNRNSMKQEFRSSYQQNQDNPGPGHYNIKGLADNLKETKNKNQFQTKNQQYQDQLFHLTHSNQKHQFLVTNYFSPKNFNQTDSDVNYLIHKKLQNINQINNFI